MTQEEMIAQIPRGKEDKPVIMPMQPLVYDYHDIDGMFMMLDKKFSGCILFHFFKPMNPQIPGRIFLDGDEITGYTLKTLAVVGNMWVLGVPLRGKIAEYSREYQLHIEGFADTDGNEMEPQDFTVKSADRRYPEEKHAEHEAIALQAAREGIVLLKNQENLLPLSKGTVLNLFGKGVHQFRVGAVGAGKINPRYTVDFLQAVRDEGILTLNEELIKFYQCDEDQIPQEDVLARAKEKSDLAIMMITRGTGENLDNSSARGEWYLTIEEDALLQKLTKTFAHTLVILNVGYPIDVTYADKYGVDALVYSGFGGMLAGQALLDILSGTVNPSGKLPDTWALDYFDIPSSKNFYDCVDKERLDADCGIYVDTFYEEDIYVGYRYFTTFGKPVAHSFGYGLSYTQFKIETRETAFHTESQLLTMEVTVENTGLRDGKEVVQVYVKQPDGELEKPGKQLVFFTKTKELKPGEKEIISVQIPANHMVSYNEKTAAYIMEAGEYIVYSGNSVEALQCGSFHLAETSVVKQVTNLLTPPQELKLLSKWNEKETYPAGEYSKVIEGAKDFTPVRTMKKYPALFDGKKPENKLTYADVTVDPSLLENFVAQLSVEELARLSVCASAGWGMEGVGEAGHIYPVEGYELPAFLVSDGNSGVNLRMANIGMPSGVTMCASFNPELVRDIGRVIGEEAKELGIPLILAPALNIHRNPLNGRQPEYFSEDPYLAGILSGYYCQGMENAGVGSCIKHLLANNCETSRKRNQSVISERAIREIYFRAFELAMEVHMPASVMTAYNACNGQPTATDEELIQGLLRKENGFNGYVMTDWGSYDSADVARMVQAGNSWITPGTMDDTYTLPIVDGIAQGTVELARLQENVTWVLKTILRFSAA